MKREELKIEFHSDDELEELAIKFHEGRRKKTFPFNVETYLNLEFDYHIVPAPRLEAGCRIDTALIACLKIIRIDEKIYERQPLRARFSLAHELSHLILHKDVIEKLVALLQASNKTDEYSSIISVLPEKAHNRAEWQAQHFGGCLLAPKNLLTEKLANAIKNRFQTTLNDKLDSEDISIICHDLSNFFQMTKEAMVVRINAAKLDWMLYVDRQFFTQE